MLSRFGLIVTVLSATLAAQPAGGVITGRVVEAGTNAPVADARVTVILMAPPAPGQIPQLYQATTGADGTFRVEGLAPGRYRVTAGKSGYAMPGGPQPPFITLEAGGPGASPVVVLQRGGVIAGRILSPSGEPIADARVVAMLRLPGAPPGRLTITGPTSMTNDLGEFRLHSLAPGDYFIQASPRPDSPIARSSIAAVVIAPTFYPGTTDAAAAQPVTIGAGRTLDGIEIGLLRTPAYSIRGAVVDEQGRAVANAAIMILPEAAEGIPPFTSPARTRTGADGSFAIEGILSGSYRLSAASPIASRNAGSGRSMRLEVGTPGAGPRGAVMTETADGVTTEYRFEPAGEVGIEIQNDHVDGVQLIAKRPAQ